MVLYAFLLPGSYLGAMLGGSRVTWDHLGLILGHPVAIFEVMLHRKACELENVDFTMVL